MIGMVLGLIALAAILGVAANLAIRLACPHLADPHPGKHGVRHLRVYTRTHQPAHAGRPKPHGRHEAPRQIGAAA